MLNGEEPVFGFRFSDATLVRPLLQHSTFNLQPSTFNILLSTLSLKFRPQSDAEAVEAVRMALKNLALGGNRVLKVVHGYGSTGLGGSNREAVRTWLAGELAAGRVRRVIPGERLTRGDVTDWKRRYSGHAAAFEGLLRDVGNEGVTVIEC
jgi:hypothetical protein